MYRCAILALAACGRIGFATAEHDGGALTIAAPATLLPYSTRALTASEPVTWSADGAAIDATGILHATGTPGEIVVTATSVADPERVAQVTLTSTTTLVPSLVAEVGATTHAVGFAPQQHGLYADALGTWWYWYTASTDPTHLRSRSSVDFATWQDGPALALGHPHGNDGRNLALADAVIADHHVVHFSVGYDDGVLGRVHARGELTSAGLAFGNAGEINAGGNQKPDGPSVAILSDGHVVDGTGWEGTPQTPPLSPCGDGDVEIYSSDVADDGTTFDATWERRVIWCVNNRVNVRWMHADGTVLHHLYEEGDGEPSPVNVLWNVRDTGGVWSPVQTVKTRPPSVFAADSDFHYGDWNATALGDLYAIRHLPSGAFEVARLATMWQAMAAPPARASVAGTGVAFIPYGVGILAAVIGTDKSLAYSYLVDGEWSPWRAFDLPEATRGELATIAGTRPAFVWTQDTAIAGAALP